MDLGVLIGGGRRLILAGTRLGWLWAAAGLAAVALIVVLYRYERRIVSKGAGRALLGLRLMAAAALVLALFEPIARVTRREAIRGRLVVGVDLSESMATADRRPEAESRALAGLIGAGGAPASGRVSRRDVARGLLGGAWWAGLGAGRDVRAVGFARGAVAGSAADLARKLGAPSAPGDPEGLATDWTPALDAALRDEAGAPVLGVVLLTDGRRNGEADAAGAADRLAARGIPVYPVLVGSTTPPRDAAIASVTAPEGVYKGDVAGVEVSVKLDGVPEGVDVPVTLDRPGASPMRVLARSTGAGARPVVSFRVPMDATGPQPMGVAVGPIDGDERPENDRKGVSIQVADDKARVLIVDGEPRWEFRYLRNALARDPRVAVDAIVLRQPPAPPSASNTYPGAVPPRPDAPGQPDPLGGYDAIVLGDVAPDDLPADLWRRLDAYVADRGGTLVVSAGPRSLASLASGEIPRRMLPVSDARPVEPGPAPPPDPARPALPGGTALRPIEGAAADAWPMLQFASDPARSRAAWEALPRLPWAAAGRPKPSASALVTPAGDASTAVVAAIPYGSGKVFWVGTDATWRWRFRVGDAYHHRFWGQVVRWAASGTLSAGNRLVRFGPDRPRLAEGDRATLRARFADEAPGVAPSLLVAARVFRAPDPAAAAPAPGSAAAEPVAVVPLRPKPGEPRAFEGPAPGLPPGRYLIRLDVPQLADAMAAEGPAPEAPLDVAPRETSELVELSASRDALDRLASATGGRVFADHDAAALLPLLKTLDRQSVRTEETPLWDRPWSLIFFCALLTAEWVVRKRAGLP